jgi:hypothetical protein
MTMAKSKEEQIFVQLNDEIIELTGKEKETFLADRAETQINLDAQIAKEEANKELKKSAYTKLGLSKEEINAIL